MIELKRFETLTPAPAAVFARLAELGNTPRYLVANGCGTWRPVTWQEHADQIRSLALFLSQGLLTRGERAAIFSPNRHEWMAAALAIQAVGGVMVPVYPSSTMEQATYVLEHCDAHVLFVDTPAIVACILQNWHRLREVRRIVTLGDMSDLDTILDQLRASGVNKLPGPAEARARFLSYNQALVAGQAINRDRFESLLASVSPDQNGIMLYTSGTSGPPKGVPLTHRNVGVNGHDWLECNAPLLDEGMTDLLWLPMSHIFGYGQACQGNNLGFTTWLTTPQEVLNVMSEVKPQVFMSVPAYWERLAMQALSEPGDARENLQRITGGRLKFCLSGGAGLKREVKTFFQACDLLIIEGYGLTETSPTLTLNRPDDFRLDSVGKPLPHVAIRLAQDGEILTRGEHVFSGYHKDPEATRSAFTEDGWFRTGDVGRWTEDGFLQIVDRKKDILITAGGKNIPPANIEVLFKDDPLIAHAVLYGDGRHYLVAGIWPHALAGGTGMPSREAIQARVDLVNMQLASHETIKDFAIMTRPLTVEEGFLTPTLKLRRRQVYEAFREELEALYS